LLCDRIVKQALRIRQQATSSSAKFRHEFDLPAILQTGNAVRNLSELTIEARFSPV
jgi:hypothetical protein